MLLLILSRTLLLYCKITGASMLEMELKAEDWFSLYMQQEQMWRTTNSSSGTENKWKKKKTNVKVKMEGSSEDTDDGWKK